ncbi:MAG: ubiquinol-cytochrome c reductase cytochrome b subunit [Actinomycetota bacterium]|nr:ubiquinol-cytochrome c reductase cytochrome b subunit [Actinomycetota bacterium]
MLIRRLSRWIDDRLGTSRFARSSLNKVFPDHWSFMLGEIALYCFVVLILTGVYLTFFFVASTKTVVYNGSYKPLQGVAMSQSYESTIRLSFDVRAGLVMRQIHHWAALVFIGAIVLHLCRIFFTGAFRRPRELNWIVGVTLLVLAIFNGFAGYSLPDDLLSGTGLRIAYSIALAIPILGTWTAFLVFGGEFPADNIISRLFVIHILIIPAAIAALLGAHLAILWRQKHTQFRGRGRREDNVVGSRLWPTYAAKSVGLFALVAGVLALLGGLAQINPVWLYGPFDPAAVSTAAQPDWYMGWIEGALRIFPPVYLHLGTYDVSELFWPAIVLPGITFALLFAWPFLERRFTHDDAEHHLLDRPADGPVRTAFGVTALTFYGILLLAGGQDIWAQRLDVSLGSVLWTFRIGVLVVPPLVGLFTWRLCRDLRAGRHSEHEGERAEPPVAPTDASEELSEAEISPATNRFTEPPIVQ